MKEREERKTLKEQQKEERKAIKEQQRLEKAREKATAKAIKEVNVTVKIPGAYVLDSLSY